MTRGNNIIASSDVEDYIQSNVTGDSIDLLRLTTVGYAKDQLNRLFRLTSMLETIEYKLEEQVQDEDISIRDLLEIYRVISTTVGNINSIIREITNDPAVIQLVVNSNFIISEEVNIDSRTQSVSLDKEGRQKVRKVLEQLKSNLEDIN